ncbi:unnamed protein product [Brachionus calyciflorus]|uniref:Uncharacterized protein n=1 Tax=Brachionus calyciflorus TaxID=104777 RepID=A0A814G7S5_9BILA|nr:unnamed protein product [Brachionus calyciflorus]
MASSGYWMIVLLSSISMGMFIFLFFHLTGNIINFEYEQNEHLNHPNLFSSSEQMSTSFQLTTMISNLESSTYTVSKFETTSTTFFSLVNSSNTTLKLTNSSQLLSKFNFMENIRNLNFNVLILGVNCSIDIRKYLIDFAAIFPNSKVSLLKSNETCIEQLKNHSLHADLNHTKDHFDLNVKPSLIIQPYDLIIDYGSGKNDKFDELNHLFPYVKSKGYYMIDNIKDNSGLNNTISSSMSKSIWNFLNSTNVYFNLTSNMTIYEPKFKYLKENILRFDCSNDSCVFNKQ